MNNLDKPKLIRLEAKHHLFVAQFVESQIVLIFHVVSLESKVSFVGHLWTILSAAYLPAHPAKRRYIYVAAKLFKRS